MKLSPAGVTASAAADAYRQVETGDLGRSSGADSFGGALQRALEGVVDAGHQADAQSLAAISGEGSITDVVTAVSKAELALQSTLAIRDKIVQAYQDVMHMAI